MNSLSCLWSFLNLRNLLICFLIFLLLHWWIRHKAFVGKLPPGPYAWPFIGALPQLIYWVAVKWEIVEICASLAKKYGSTYILQIAGVKAVVTQDLKTMKELVHSRINDRPLDTLSNHLFKQGKGILFSNGKSWLEQRKFTMSVLRHFGVGKRSFEDQISTEAQYLARELHSQIGRPMELTQLFKHATSNVLCSVIFGKRFDYADPKFIHLLHLMDKKFNRPGQTFLVMMFPFLFYLPFGPGKQIKEDVCDLTDCIRKIIEQHQQTLDPENVQDFIDTWLVEINKINDPESYINVDNLAMTTEDLFLAGTDTTSIVLRWTVLYMMAFPKVQMLVQQEIDKIVGRKCLPTLADKPKLPYTEATIHEILRFCSISDKGILRFTTRDVKLQEYVIPKGTMIISNQLGLNRDPSIWEDPDEFKPDRFLDENGCFIQKEELLTFGEGYRSCLGKQLAMMELFIFITRMLHQFDFKKPKETDQLNLAPRHTTMATLEPYPFKVCIYKRM